MPPALYFYINFCIIQDEDTRRKTNLTISPKLRDVEWMFFYDWFISRGFSGFMNDEEFTCNRLVDKVERGIDLDPKELQTLNDLPYLKTKSGAFKKYIPAKDYLYKTHKKNLGLPLYDNEAKNSFWLTSRGSGKSFSEAGIITHCYATYGKKYYDNDYINAKEGPEIIVGAALSDKSSELLKKFQAMQEYLKVGPGAFGDDEDFTPGYFYNSSMGSLAPNNGRSPYRHEYHKNMNGTWVITGTGTKIIHVIFGDNPEAAVGRRPEIMVIDEVGLMDNLLQCHASNETTLIRKTKFGSALYAGTGGNIDKIVESKIIFLDPDTYDMVSYPDMWENNRNNIGFFLPAYYTDTSFKDENGNTDIEAAYKQELVNRKKREQATNSMAIDGYIMARPLVPSEMFLSATANIFPIAKLREREAWLETSNSGFWTVVSIGDLDWNDKDRKSVKWREDLSSKRKSRPILYLNLDQYKNNIEGAITVYEHPPEHIPNPTYQRSLYKIVYDPIKDDKWGTSLASIIVYKGYSDSWNSGMQNTIVAEWIGRPDKVDDVHDICLKLSYYYNALILVENNLPGFINYCRNNNYTHKLMLSPTKAISKSVKNYSNKYDFGVTINSQLKLHCEQLIRQWLLEPWKKEEGKDLESNVSNLFSLRIIRELIAYNREGNFDHISSLMLLMLWLSQERETVHVEPGKVSEKYKELDTFLNTTVRTITKTSNWYNY